MQINEEIKRIAKSVAREKGGEGSNHISVTERGDLLEFLDVNRLGLSTKLFIIP